MTGNGPRDARGMSALDALARDARGAVRSLRKDAGLAAVVVLTLALGLGATTAIFSVVHAVLLRPLPYASPDRLAMIWETDRNSSTRREAASVPDFFDIRARARAFDGVAGFTPFAVNFTRAGLDAERLDAALVTHELFPLLGATPIVGRAFRADEDVPGAAGTAIISEGLWKSRFGGDPDVVGRTMVLDDSTYTIVGVMPARVAFPDEHVAVWVPLRAGPTSAPRSMHDVNVIGRLRAGATLGGAQRELVGIMAELEREYPQTNAARGANVEMLETVVLGPVRPALVALLGAAGLVLLIACANAASLLLARTAARRREIAVRVALGAGVGRLAQQFFAESAVIALGAAVLGVGVALAGVRGLVAIAPSNVPRIESVSVDVAVLAFALGLALLVTLACGLAPVLAARGLDVQAILKADRRRAGGGGRGERRGRSALVAAEVALSVVLVIGAGLMLRSVWALQHVNPGFVPDRLLEVQYRLPASAYPQDFASFPRWARVSEFHQALLQRVQALPDVADAAIASNHPMDAGFTTSFVIVGREAEAAHQAEIHVRSVTPSYLRTAGVPLLAGRALTEHDDASAAPVVLINEAAARKYFPDASPLGQHVRFWGASREIVGVIGDEKFDGLAKETPPAVYPPLAQVPITLVSLIVRTRGDPMAVLPSLRAAVREIDANVALYGATTMRAAVAGSVGRERFTLLLLAAFAALALVLAAIGVHGVLSYTVTQRRHELGVRMALGAPPRSVLGLVVGDGLRLAGAGIAIGIVGALAATRVLRALLFQVTATDAATYGAVALVIGAVALLASYFPAKRATRVDPRMVLEAE
jgi:putative ABC transport system permease protein